MSGKRKYTLDESVFENIDTEEKAYWLGFILADGCIVDRTNDNRKSKLLTIHLKYSDIEHLKKFKKFLKTEKPIYIGFNKLNDKKFKFCSIHVTCDKLAQDLIKLGITCRKSLKEKFPRIDPDLIRHMIRGFWDGDGSVLFYQQRRASKLEYWPEIAVYGGITSIKFIQNNFNANLNILLNVQKNRTLKKLKTTGYKTIPILRYLYKDAKIYLSRKYETYEDIMNWHHKKGG